MARLIHQSLVVAVCAIMAASMAHAARRANPVVVVSQATLDTIIHEVRLSGTVSSPRVARLSAEVSGLIKALQVDAGSVVKAGDVLMMLDTEREGLSLQAATAAELAAAAKFADTKRRLADGRQLAEKKTLSVSELKSLEAEADIAHATLQRHGAERQLQQARLKRHRLAAPFAGVISQKFVEVGEWIQPGDAVVELVAYDNLRIDFQVPQLEFSRIRPSSKVRVTLDTMPDKSITGTIQAIVPYSDSDARTFLLRVSLPESGPAIAPGMSASGLLRLDTRSQGIVVPRDAVLRYADGRITVWVVSSSDDRLVVSERQVKAGQSFNGRVSILNGLNAGERVVVEGNEALRDGQTVILHKP